MKNYSFLLLALLFSSSLFAQTALNTDAVGSWTSGQISCHQIPLTPAEVAGLSFPNPPTFSCTGTSAAGNLKMGIGDCGHGNNVARVFHNTHNFDSQPCLVTYNFAADNAFRIYVNGNSSPTNSLPGADGVCGDRYSGNDWTSAFPGTLNIADFQTGNNNIDFETQNGIENIVPHPFWLSGSLLFWQFSDLNSSLYAHFDNTADQIFAKYQFTPQTNGAMYSLRVEFTNSFPLNQNWVTHFIKTGTAKQFKISPNIPPIPTGCDFNGAAARITFTAMAGSCQNTTVYQWTCGPGFDGSPNEQVTQTTSNTDNPNIALTPEQIKDIHDQFNEKLTIDNNLKFSLDSLFATDEGQSTLQVFPNPSNGHIWVKAAASEDYLTPIKIFNQLGGLVFEGQIQGRQDLDLSALPDGLYFLKTLGEKSSDLKSTQFILRR